MSGVERRVYAGLMPCRMEPESPANTTRRRHVLLAGVAAVLGGCSPDGEAQSRSDGMFGLFKGSREHSTVPASVGAQLVREQAYPAGLAAPSLSYGRSTELAVAGTPPRARFEAQHESGRTARAFRIDTEGLAPVLLLNADPDAPRIDAWELGAGDSFVRQRPVALDPAQQQWAGHSVQQVQCLPARQQAVVVHYVPREARYGLFLHDAASGSFRRVADRLQRDTWKPLPASFIDVLPVTREAALLVYRTDAQRLAAETYVNTKEHVLLFSPAQPAGLEVLTLDVADGNIQRWAVRERKLYIEAVDPRQRGKPVTHRWSLDLSRVL